MDKNKPAVRVIMPVYNGENTIKYALTSLLNQTYDNWNCVIVNDGSTDGTFKILNSLKDPRFHIYHLDQNKGRGSARDIALRYAKGDYLTYLDADDMMHRDKLRVQVEFMETHPEVRMVSCGYITMNENFEALRSSGLSDFISDNIMKYGQALPLLLGAIMVRLDQARIFSYNHYLDVGEDYDYFARYCEGYRYANIGQPYYYYLIGNVTARKLLYYQVNCLKGCVVYWKRGNHLKAVISAIKRCAKIVSYALLIPIIGVERLVNNRGNTTPLLTENRDVFYKETKVIKQLKEQL